LNSLALPLFYLASLFCFLESVYRSCVTPFLNQTFLLDLNGESEPELTSPQSLCISQTQYLDS
ncbi:hypothetical protein A2U01_0055780, partial [Trifolium medium]|nr:hypothetical protein [Trifolium medium]